jgi:hypothetical protein
MRDAILAGNENFSYATARAAEAKISLAPAAQGVGGEKAPSAAAGGAADKGRHCGVKRKLPTPAAAGKTKTAKVAVYGSQSKGPAKDQDQGKAKGKGKGKAKAKGKGKGKGGSSSKKDQDQVTEESHQNG